MNPVHNARCVTDTMTMTIPEVSNSGMNSLLLRDVELFPTGSTITYAFGNEVIYDGDGYNISHDFVVVKGTYKENRTAMDPLEKIIQERDSNDRLKIPVEDGIALILRRIEKVANLNFVRYTGPPEMADILIMFSSGINGTAGIGRPLKRYVHPRERCTGLSYNGLCHNMTLGTYSVPVIMHEFMHMLGFMHETVHAMRPFTFSTQGWKNLWGSEDAKTFNFATVSPQTYRGDPPFDPLSIMLYWTFSSDYVDDQKVSTYTNMYPSAADLLGLRFLYPGRTSIEELDVLYQSWFGEGLLANLERSWSRVCEFTSGCYDSYSIGGCPTSKEDIKTKCTHSWISSGCQKTCGICKPMPMPPRPRHPFYDDLIPAKASGYDTFYTTLVLGIGAILILCTVWLYYIRRRKSGMSSNSTAVEKSSTVDYQPI